MATITAADVNKLRQSTGAGMMDCKKALVEADGDFDKAIQILREKPCVISGHKRDNTIPGQRRRNQKRGFPIWHLRTLFMKQGERCVRKFKKHKICECVGRIRRLPGGCSGKRASSGMSGDQHGGGSGGGGRKRAGGRRRAGGWRHNEGEESTGAMEKSN